MLYGEQVAVKVDGLATWLLAFRPSGPEGAVVGKGFLRGGAELSFERRAFQRSLRLSSEGQALRQDRLVQSRCRTVGLVADRDDTGPPAVGQDGRRVRFQPRDA